MDTQVQEEKAIRRNTAIPERGIERISQPKRKPDTVRASVYRSCAYNDRDTAKVCRGASGRLYQREKRDSNRPKLYGPEGKFYSTKFLGTRVIRVNSRTE
jgi:hypothetical protein